MSKAESDIDRLKDLRDSPEDLSLLDISEDEIEERIREMKAKKELEEEFNENIEEVISDLRNDDCIPVDGCVDFRRINSTRF